MAIQKENGSVSIDAQNIMPVIKKWLYSDKDIFLRETVSNACDAITKFRMLHPDSEEPMTVTVSDSVNSPRTPLSQAARHKSDNGESFSAEGSGPDGKVLVFFDNALVYEYDVNFDTGEIH